MERLKDISIVDSINRVGGGDVEKYLERAASRVVNTDYVHFKYSLEPLGFERAREVHARIFTAGTKGVVKEAIMQLGLAKVADLRDLALLISYLYANELRITQTEQKGEGRIEVQVKTCPFLYYGKQFFDEPDGSRYFQSLWWAEQKRILEMGRATELREKLIVEQKSFMCNGDKECTIILRTTG